MRYQGQTNYDHKGSSPRTGVILNNLGTPDAPTPGALRRYLREFLSDPRVVEIPRLVWMLILHLIILRVRPARSARLYKAIWTDEGSPLLAITKRQATLLQQRLDQRYGEGVVPVVVGMRYGNPSLAHAVDELTGKNVHNMVVLPLYPQYSGATTGSTFDALSQQLSKKRWVPGLHFINGYHQHPAYVQAIANKLKHHIAENGMPDRIVFSYHGTPERYLKSGDPYYCFCQQTTRLVRETLQLAEDQLLTTFQSRFGGAPWLQPYTDKTLQQLPNDGVKHILILCPGFSTDCLETLEEIEVENRTLFMEAGGETFHYLPCLNDDDDHIEMMMQLVVPHLVSAS